VTGGPVGEHRGVATGGTVIDLGAHRHRAEHLAAPRISAVVCVYTMERWTEIELAVESLLSQQVAPLEILVVVDHNDELLAKAIERFSSEGTRNHIPVHVVPSEGTRGLSGARNTGVELSRGEVVAFLDDDAWADDSWIGRMADHYRDPSVMGVGGHATPIWPDARPTWMPVEFDWVVGCSYRGQPVSISAVRNFIGCNMSLRRSAFELVGGFSSAVGRIGKTPLGCEETELCIRIRQADPTAELRYDPSVAVHHRVSADRVRRRYFLRRCYAEGLSKAVVSQLVGAGDALDSERRYVTQVLPSGVLTGLRDAVSGHPAAGLQRAALIITGLFVTVTGYGVGRARIGLGLHTVDRGQPDPVAPVGTLPATGSNS
jgi:GT2 family glycosyltransferase